MLNRFALRLLRLGRIIQSPFMIPAEFREKKRTMPAYLPSTARFLAEMLETDLEKLSAQLWTNSCKVFNLPEE